MSLAHTRKKNTILGNIVFLIVVTVVIYFFINFITNFQINKIAKINDKYLVTSNYLIPENTFEYSSELDALNQEKYTEPITGYVALDTDARKIERYIEYSFFEQGCLSRTTLSKIDTQIQNKDILYSNFTETYSKKLDKIYWKSYISEIDNYDIEYIRTRAEELEMC